MVIHFPMLTMVINVRDTPITRPITRSMIVNRALFIEHYLLMIIIFLLMFDLHFKSFLIDGN